MKHRVGTLERSVNALLESSSGVRQTSDDQGKSSKKRSATQAFGSATHREDGPTKSEAPTPPPFSAFEAQSMIKQEIGRLPYTSESRKDAFYSALSTLKQSLNTAIVFPDGIDWDKMPVRMEGLTLPSVELIHWMLQCKFPSINEMTLLTFPSQGLRKTVLL